MAIPLGLGDYDLASVAQQLDVSQVVLLPAFPTASVDPMETRWIISL